MERFAEESQSRSVPRKHSPFLFPLVQRATKLVSSANPITIDHRTSGKRERGRERGEEGDRQIDSKIHSKVSVTLPYSLWRATQSEYSEGCRALLCAHLATIECYLDCS